MVSELGLKESGLIGELGDGWSNERARFLVIKWEAEGKVAGRGLLASEIGQVDNFGHSIIKPWL